MLVIGGVGLAAGLCWWVCDFSLEILEAGFMHNSASGVLEHFLKNFEVDQTGWGGRMSKSVCLLFWEIEESGPSRFEPILSQTDDFKIDTWCFLARRSALLGQGKYCLAQCQDNMTESWCWWPGVPVRQHYKVIISACFSVPVLMLLGHKTTNKQTV